MPLGRRVFIISLVPVVVFLALWLISAVFGEWRLFHFTLGNTLVQVTSTSWRALEIAVVANPAFVREAEYCVLPKTHAPVLGMYLGPVQVAPPGSGWILLMPYYAPFLAAMTWPLVLNHSWIFQGMAQASDRTKRPPTPSRGPHALSARLRPDYPLLSLRPRRAQLRFIRRRQSTAAQTPSKKTAPSDA